jgi:hypothetical protein
MTRASAVIIRESVDSRTRVTIYALRDPRTRQVRYVGKAIDPRGRYRQHLSGAQLSRYRSKKNSWIKGVLADGLKPKLEILQIVAGDRANAAEIAWIAYYRAAGVRLTNGTNGGDGGAITDPDARARISAGNRGKKISEETKRKVSLSLKARITPEERERLRSISNGKPPIHIGEKNPRAKLSDARVRRLREHAAAGGDPLTLADEFGITAASVTQLVCGQFRRSAGGPTREAKPRSKLTAVDLVEIHRLLDDGVLNQTEIARKFGVDPSHISNIRRGQRRRLAAQ